MTTFWHRGKDEEGKDRWNCEYGKSYPMMLCDLAMQCRMEFVFRGKLYLMSLVSEMDCCTSPCSIPMCGQCPESDTIAVSFFRPTQHCPPEKCGTRGRKDRMERSGEGTPKLKAASSTDGRLTTVQELRVRPILCSPLSCMF